MQLLIIDQCSDSKAGSEKFGEEELDSHSREELLARKQTPTYAAQDLYTGLQQRYISDAADRLRSAGDAVERVIISAGFGVVEEDEQLPPYNVTFAGRSDEEIKERSTRLEIHEDILGLFQCDSTYDLIFFALGSDYYQSLDLEELLREISDSTIVVLFNQEGLADEYGRNVVSIPARNGEASKQGTNVIGLKGRYLRNFAEHRAHGAVVETPEDIVTYCSSEYSTQTDFDEYGS